jgi:hypothetical protein
VAFSLPTLPPTQPDWSAFQIWWQQVVQAITEQETRQDDLLDAIIAADAAAAAAQAAADSAQTAADTANTAASTATTAASAAQDTADAITEADTLNKSWVTGCTITATDAGTDTDITISAHTRKYPQPDGSTVDVAVAGATLHGRAYATGYYVYYDDAPRAGGTVSYQTTTAEPAQIGDRHVVGYVLTPAAAAPPTGGGTTRPPGSGSVLV